MSEERFLERLAAGKSITQDDYAQMVEFIAPEALAQALVRRFDVTSEAHTLLEAAELYASAGLVFEAVELCSRFPRVSGMRALIRRLLPALRAELGTDYPISHHLGHLTNEAFLVIDVQTGSIERLPPILPAR